MKLTGLCAAAHEHATEEDATAKATKRGRDTEEY